MPAVGNMGQSFWATEYMLIMVTHGWQALQAVINANAGEKELNERMGYY